MRKLVTLMLFVSFVTILSCSKKEKPMESEFDRFAPLTDQQVSELLEKAKSNSSAQPVDPMKVLTEDEINDILATVAATQVEQIADKEIALLETNVGTLAIAFYTDVAPEHCKGFKRLVTSGFYNGTKFHRIIDGFVVQGGDILTRDANPDNDGTGGPGYTLPAEFNGIRRIQTAPGPSFLFACRARVPHLWMASTPSLARSSADWTSYKNSAKRRQ